MFKATIKTHGIDKVLPVNSMGELNRLIKGGANIISLEMDEPVAAEPSPLDMLKDAGDFVTGASALVANFAKVVTDIDKTFAPLRARTEMPEKAQATTPYSPKPADIMPDFADNIPDDALITGLLKLARDQRDDYRNRFGTSISGSEVLYAERAATRLKQLTIERDEARGAAIKPNVLTRSFATNLRLKEPALGDEEPGIRLLREEIVTAFTAGDKEAQEILGAIYTKLTGRQLVCWMR